MRAVKNSYWKQEWKNVRRYKDLLALFTIVIAYFVIFKYIPMYGVTLAFKDFRLKLGILRSPWAGLKHFRLLFSTPSFFEVLRNTVSISLLRIVFGFPAPILLALLLNEVGNNKFKRTVQTITYMPYFISMVVMCSIIRIYCQENGLFSQIAEFFGGSRKNYLMDAGAFRPIHVLSGIWQGIGWNSIIYLAALAGIDQAQYEAARIDGANRFQQVLHITIPGILPTIVVLFVLRMGSILNVGYEKVLLLYNTSIYETADVLSTYIYRMGLESQKYSLSTAVGLFNTLVNIVFLVLTNWISRRTTESGLF